MESQLQPRERQTCAQKLVERFGTEEEVNVVQITGTPGSSVADDRQKGFEEELSLIHIFIGQGQADRAGGISAERHRGFQTAADRGDLPGVSETVKEE